LDAAATSKDPFAAESRDGGNPMKKITALSTLITVVLAVGVYGLVAADEPPTQPVPQHPIDNAFLDSLVGTWTTQSVSKFGGTESKGAGRATFAKGVGDTALLETYESTGQGPDGKTMTLDGHAVIKVSVDGKTANLWWFCNMSPDALKLTGSLTDSGTELSGDDPLSGHVTASMKKTPDGFSLHLAHNGHEMTETYARAK
jgi:hypothetical protein